MTCDPTGSNSIPQTRHGKAWVGRDSLVLGGVLLAVHVALLLVSLGGESGPGATAPFHLALLLCGLFLFSLLVSLVAVLSGIGGGVVYTPLLLAFTPLHSLIVRATGLVVALFSGLISSSLLLRRGVGNLKIATLSNLGYAIGGLAGSRAAIWAGHQTGETGEGVIRLVLGGLIAALATYFLTGGAKREWPKVTRVDRFTARLNLCHPYYEPSLGRMVECVVTRAGWGAAAMSGVGFVAGFFGLGGGWAIVPVLNLVMGVPLKVATAASNLIIGMGGALTITPYLAQGAVVPLLLAPLIAGHVLGGLIGARLLVHLRSGLIRRVLIGVLFYASFGLITNGLKRLGTLAEVPRYLHIAVPILIAILVAHSVRRRPEERADA